LADNGYFSATNVAACPAAGIEPLIALGRQPHHPSLSERFAAARRLSFPPVTDPEVPPLRPERHIPNSIATLRRRMIVALTKRLSRCPCCARKIAPNKRLTL